MNRQFPCILRGSHIWLAFDKHNATTLDSDHGKNRGNINFEHDGFENITAEYLANTYGEVKSKEHAEFIVKLCENAGIEVFPQLFDANHFVIKGKLSFHNCERITSSELKQITIPLPPESNVNTPEEDFEKNNGDNLIFGDADKCKEWPCVGDEVLIYDLGFDRDTKGIYKGENKNGVPIIELDDGGVFLLGFEGRMTKPKTPAQELRDELSKDINNAYYYETDEVEFADLLIQKYNITKKPQ